MLLCGIQRCGPNMRVSDGELKLTAALLLNMQETRIQGT